MRGTEHISNWQRFRGFYFAFLLTLWGGVAQVVGGAEVVAGSSAKVTVGDPAQAAALPAAILNAYAAGSRDITITPGIYRIPPTGKPAIRLEGWQQATIRAAGVTLVFEALGQRPVRLDHCDGVAWVGGTLRFAGPSFTQGRIKAIGTDAGGKYFDWQIDTGYPVFDPAKAKSFLDVVDQGTRLLKPGTGDLGCAHTEPLGPGLFRMRQMYGETGPAAVGDWLFTRRPDGGSSLIELDGCRQCTLRQVTLQNAGFAAFFEAGGEGGNCYADCRVEPGPKPPGATEEPLVGCGADGFHSVGTRTGPSIERCVWAGVLHDDCIAIHGSLQAVIRSVGDKLVLEQGNRGGFAAGEPVRIAGTNGFFGEFTCLTRRELKDEGGRLELTLDRVSGAPAGAEASNPQRNGAGYRIVNCTLGNCRSRGILVKADNGLIEGCTISGCGMSAISIGPEYYWREADYVKNVTVRGNTLRNNVLNGSGTGTVFIHGEGAVGNGEISLVGNWFDRNYGRTEVDGEDTETLRVWDNRFVTSPVTLPGGGRTVLAFKADRAVSLRGNTVENSAASDTLVKLGKDVEGIGGNDDSGIHRRTGK